MKHLFFFIFSVLLSPLLYSQVPSLRLSGTIPDGANQWALESDDISKACCVSIARADSDTNLYEFVDAQFIFAPQVGTAVLLSFSSTQLPEAALNLIRNTAVVGDKFLIDKVRIKINGNLVHLAPIIVEVREKTE